jgi:3-oxoadipate enol-lactonase/4-carboxymuconolactone decarboxylase
MWPDRIGRVHTSGTAVLVSSQADRWFAPGFLEREPDRGAELLHALYDADDEGYVHVCYALGQFDVRDRLGEITQPVLAVAGSHDQVTPSHLLRSLASGVQDGRFVELDGVAHLAPAERPDVVARLLRELFLGETSDRDGLDLGSETVHRDPREAGLAVRRDVLGAEHVDRSLASASDLSRDFQEFISTYAWGGVWTRPGLDRRSRSMVTLAALVAGGHHEELALHLRAGRRNGLSWDEIKEVLLQTAVYCGVPAANTAFRIAEQVRAEGEQ